MTAVRKPITVRGRLARRRASSPPADPLALSGPLVGLSFLGGLGTAMALSDLPYPRPGSSPEEIRRYFSQGSRAPRVSAAGQLVSAAALVAFTASVARLAARSDRDARGLQATAIAGGSIAAASLATSAVCAAALAGRRGDDDTRAVALARRAFLAGGPTHGFGFGLLVGALGLAGRRTGELPRPLALTGLIAAIPNLLSPLYLVAEPAGWFIPAGRFPGLVVSAVAGVRLSRPSR
jgi:hypothetical protein